MQLTEKRRAQKVFSSKSIEKGIFSVYTGTKRPTGEKLDHYTENGRYSGVKSESRKTQLNQQFKTRKKEAWEKMPSHLEEIQDDWVAERLMSRISRETGLIKVF